MIMSIFKKGKYKTILNECISHTILSLFKRLDTYKCSICDLSFPGIDMPIFSWERMSQNKLKLWLRFFWKSQFERAYWTSSYKQIAAQEV